MTLVAAKSSWRRAQLREVCEQVRRVLPPESAEAERRPYLSLEDIESGTGRILGSTLNGAGKSTTFAFGPGDVLYGKLRPYLNKVALPDFEGRCTTELVPIRPKPGVDREFLAWWLRRPETVAAAMQEKTGSRMPRADMDVLMHLALRLPPVDEQKRIASMLTRQLAYLSAAAKAGAERLAATQRLPQSVIDSAFSESHRAAWPAHALETQAAITSGVTLGRRLDPSATRLVPYLRVANVKDGYLALDDVKETPATEDEIAKLRLEVGDIVLTEGGDPDKLGRGTYWTGQIPECIHQNHIFRVRLPSERYLPAFVSFQLASRYGKAYFLKHAKRTTGIATINRTVLGRFPLLCPPLNFQELVVAEIHQGFRHIERMRIAVEEELESLNRIPAALLREAFNGTT